MTFAEEYELKKKQLADAVASSEAIYGLVYQLRMGTLTLLDFDAELNRLEEIADRAISPEDAAADYGDMLRGMDKDGAA